MGPRQILHMSSFTVEITAKQCNLCILLQRYKLICFYDSICLAYRVRISKNEAKLAQSSASSPVHTNREEEPGTSYSKVINR